MSEDYDVFLSYSYEDRDWVRDLSKALSQRNLRVWSGLENIQVGDSWSDEIDNALRKSKSFVIVISPKSVSSSFMAAELGSALALKKFIIPIVSEDTPSEGLPGPVKLRRFISMDEPEIVAEEISRRIITRPHKYPLSKDEGRLCATN